MLSVLVEDVGPEELEVRELLSDTPLGDALPPLETLILTTTTPCLALSPSILARSSLDGFSSLSMVGPLLSSTARAEMSPAFSWKTLCQDFPISTYKVNGAPFRDEQINLRYPCR